MGAQWANPEMVTACLLAYILASLTPAATNILAERHVAFSLSDILPGEMSLLKKLQNATAVTQAPKTCLQEGNPSVYCLGYFGGCFCCGCYCCQTNQTAKANARKEKIWRKYMQTKQ
nr:protein E6A [Equid gammaherpesvirus 5]UTK45681.1 protein E6A [Equid gammaherpesvirus 5]